ncbi:extracellular solute-binding protein [Shinella yambaruensis]|uniref:Putrescine-binding periplasmic protein n=1 Tax=Shinella yambaruensis TaxID=415996 RepID=A0ABQ5ZVR4_9HYPH|nr:MULTISPECIES: extracellular solute-binding protein [Shinella]MCJ8028915.1 extracellular solute-binding protein [Shinella yambaruensis]MCU7981971.1 extracellular solute-binding protein [Shinella yambaruensis]MCW5708851.1 extracellular solute-binding protein [Shinella sp.]GLR54774.1 ABC transporter [Shinella yambaruensis]
MSLKSCLGAAFAAVALLASPAGAQDAEKTLYFYNWTDYYPVELLAKFEKETGIKVILDGYDSNDTLLAKLQSGGASYDVIVPSDYVIPGLVKDGLLMKIDTHAMSNYAHMKDAFKNPEFDPRHEYSAPYLWGVTGLAYDSAQVPGGMLEPSWKEYFEPRPELAGKIAALDTASDEILAASLYLGIPQCTESNEDAARILALLQAQKEKLKLYSSDSTVDRMASGEVAMHHLWNGATARATAQRDTIRFLYPKEGTPMFRDNFAVPANAPHPENAKIFINWMMAPENAAAVSNAIAYANAMKSDEFLSDQWRKMDAINMPEDFASRLVATQDCNGKARELRDRIWTRLKG